MGLHCQTSIEDHYCQTSIVKVKYCWNIEYCSNSNQIAKGIGTAEEDAAKPVQNTMLRSCSAELEGHLKETLARFNWMDLPNHGTYVLQFLFFAMNHQL